MVKGNCGIGRMTINFQLIQMLRNVGFIVSNPKDGTDNQVSLSNLQYQLYDGSRIDIWAGYDGEIWVEIIPPDEVKDG